MLERIVLDQKNDGEDNFTWLHLSSATADEILLLNERYGIPIDYLSNVLDPHEISRTEGIDEDKEPILISLLYPINDLHDIKDDNENKKKLFIQESGTYSVRLLSIVLTKDLLLTSSAKRLAFDKILTSKRQPDYHGGDMEHSIDLDRLEPELSYEYVEDVISLLLWEINRQFIQAMRVLETRRKTIASRLAHSSKTELLMAISQLQESLVRFEIALEENSKVIETINQYEAFNKNVDLREWQRDIQIESYQAKKMVIQESRMLNQLNNTFSSIISNNLNVTMKILTSLTIILTVPTIISGLWGMNVSLPFENNAAGFWIVILLTTALSLGIAYWLNRKDLF